MSPSSASLNLGSDSPQLMAAPAAKKTTTRRPRKASPPKES